MNLEELIRSGAAYRVQQAVAAAKEEAEKQALLSGTQTIISAYHDGEYLSGYQVFGAAAQLLTELGLARYYSGWGYLVEERTIKALGAEFTYTQAAEYVRPAREAEAARQKAKTDARQARITTALTEAKRTGRPVTIETWTEDCDGSVEDCNVDSVARIALPNGRIVVERTHSY